MKSGEFEVESRFKLSELGVLDRVLLGERLGVHDLLEGLSLLFMLPTLLVLWVFLPPELVRSRFMEFGLGDPDLDVFSFCSRFDLVLCLL